MKGNVKLTILIPVRNEGVNIPVMLRVLEAVVEAPHEVLVVYDSPDDDTVPAVKAMQGKYPNVRLVENRLGLGVDNAIRAGVAASAGEYILIFAADEVGPVLAIEDMMTLLDDGCDLVSCTRYAHGGRRLGGSLVGGLLSRVGNRMLMLLSGSSFTDSTTGIKMFRKSIFDKIRLESKPVGWVVVFEIAIKAQAAGLKLGEVPIISIDRLYGGKSTFSVGPWLSEYLKWFIWAVRNLRGRSIPTPKLRIPKTTIVE